MEVLTHTFPMVIPQEFISEVFHTRQEVTCFLQSVIRHSTAPVGCPNTHLPYTSPRVHSVTHSAMTIEITSSSQCFLEQFDECTKTSSTVNFFIFKSLESPILLVTQPGSYLWGWDRQDISPSPNLSEKLRLISYFIKITKLMFALSFHTDSKKNPKKQQKSPTQEWKTTPPNISQAETLDSKKPVETGMQGHIRGAKYQTVPTVGQTDKAQLHTGK